jgi:phage terminase Nu1 subunit (DNA packaging protein)
MTRLQLARLRQQVRDLKGRRATLERIAMQHHAMVAASLLERRFRPGAPAAYYLSIPTPQTSRHRYVRKAEVDVIRRQTGAWREFSQAMSEWMEVGREIERLLRKIGKGRCRKVEDLLKKRRKG